MVLLAVGKFRPRVMHAVQCHQHHHQAPRGEGTIAYSDAQNCYNIRVVFQPSEKRGTRRCGGTAVSPRPRSFFFVAVEAIIPAYRIVLAASFLTMSER